MMAYSPPLPPRPPPPPPPPLQIGNFAAASSSGSAPSSLNFSPSVLIIFAIIAFVFLASVAIHLLLRFLSRSPDSSLRSRASASASASSAAAPASAEASAAKEVSDGEKATLIERLPLFTLASALSALPKSSPDCAVCQDPFRPDDELRLLPACRHAFHSRCVDPWLRSTLLCPLCRSSISLPFPPLILPPPPTTTTTTTTAAAAAAAAAAAPPIDDDPSLGAAPRSGSFRIEMGTVSRRRTDPEDAGTTQAPHTIRSYAMESYDYMVEEEVEAVISVIPPRRADAAAAAAAVAKEEKRAEGSGRYRVKDRLDRFTASASSSFNSLRWSNLYDDGGGGGGGGGGWWDLEEGQARDGDEGGGGGGGLYAFYRWITGV